MPDHYCTGDVETCSRCNRRRDEREWHRDDTDDRMADDYADREWHRGWE